MRHLALHEGLADPLAILVQTYLVTVRSKSSLPVRS